MVCECDLTTCKQHLAMRECDLAWCELSLTLCECNLTECERDLTRCEGDPTRCEGVLATRDDGIALQIDSFTRLTYLSRAGRNTSVTKL